MLYCLLSRFGIKIKITTTIIYSWKKRHMNYLKNKFLYKTKMLYYDRIDFCEGIVVNKTSASEE